MRVVALDKNFHMKCYKCEVSCPFCLAEVSLSLGKTKGLASGGKSCGFACFLCIYMHACIGMGVLEQ